jgi:hypothetical protein
MMYTGQVAAIRYAHNLASLPTPTDSEAVKATLRGIRRTIGAAKVKKAPAVTSRIKAMLPHAPPRLAASATVLSCCWGLAAQTVEG